MPEAAIADLDRRVTSLESVVTSSLNRIEGLIRQEIQDLKTEQISDLKKSIERIGDDQRRVWEAVRSLEGDDKLRTGAARAVDKFGNFISIGLGATIGAIVTWLTSGRHP